MEQRRPNSWLQLYSAATDTRRFWELVSADEDGLHDLARARGVSTQALDELADRSPDLRKSLVKLIVEREAAPQPQPPPSVLDLPHIDPFFDACAEGRLAEVQEFVTGGFRDARTPAPDGTTAFFMACQAGHLELVKFMAEDLRVDVSHPTRTQASPCFAACANGHLQVVVYLSTLVGNIHKPNANGVTPFQIACKNGHLEVVKFLTTQLGYNSRPRTAHGRTPFALACRHGHVGVAKYLVEQLRLTGSTSSWSADGQADALHGACQQGQLAAVKYLVGELQVDPQQGGNLFEGAAAIHVASAYGQLGVLKFLVEQLRVDVNTTTTGAHSAGQTALHISCRHGQLAIVQYLLQAGLSGADLLQTCQKRASAFWYACHGGNLGVVQLLATALANRLEPASFQQHVQRATWAAGTMEPAGLQPPTDEGLEGIEEGGSNRAYYTPFHIACANRRLEVGRYLAGELGVKLGRQNWPSGAGEWPEVKAVTGAESAGVFGLKQTSGTPVEDAWKAGGNHELVCWLLLELSQQEVVAGSAVHKVCQPDLARELLESAKAEVVKRLCIHAVADGRRRIQNPRRLGIPSCITAPAAVNLLREIVASAGGPPVPLRSAMPRQRAVLLRQQLLCWATAAGGHGRLAATSAAGSIRTDVAELVAEAIEGSPRSWLELPGVATAWRTWRASEKKTATLVRGKDRLTKLASEKDGLAELSQTFQASSGDGGDGSDGKVEAERRQQRQLALQATTVRIEVEVVRLEAELAARPAAFHWRAAQCAAIQAARPNAVAADPVADVAEPPAKRQRRAPTAAAAPATSQSQAPAHGGADERRRQRP